MGNLLSKPNLSAITTSVSSPQISAISCEMQGYRPTMEDFITISLSLPSHPSFSLLAIFDGHRTDQVSSYLSRTLSRNIDSLPALTAAAILEEILRMDADLIAQDLETSKSGSTIIMALLDRSSYPFQGTVFNLGDSRAFIHKRRPNSFERLSEDHKADAPGERARIEAAGGYVTTDSGCSRVDGDLAMSRAFGDSELKGDAARGELEQKVIALGEARAVEVEEGDVLFMTCDGIFENSAWEDVFDFLRANFFPPTGEQGEQREGRFCKMEAGRALMRFAEEKGSHDNMSVVVAEFSREGGFEERERAVEFCAEDIYEKFRDDGFLRGFLEMGRKAAVEDAEILFRGLRKKMEEASGEEEINELVEGVCDELGDKALKGEVGIKVEVVEALRKKIKEWSENREIVGK